MLNLLAYLHCNHIALKPAPCWHVRLSLMRESSFPLHHQLSPSDGSSPWETYCSLSHLEGKSTTNRTLLAQYPSWRFSQFLYSPLESVSSRRTVIYSAPFPSLILSWIHPIWLLSHPFTESTLLQGYLVASAQSSLPAASRQQVASSLFGCLHLASAPQPSPGFPSTLRLFQFLLCCWISSSWLLKVGAALSHFTWLGSLLQYHPLRGLPGTPWSLLPGSSLFSCHVSFPANRHT